jgi:hypothetical protein
MFLVISIVVVDARSTANNAALVPPSTSAVGAVNFN